MIDVEILNSIGLDLRPQDIGIGIVEEGTCSYEGGLVDCRNHIISPEAEEVIRREHELGAGVIGVGSIGISGKRLLQVDGRDGC